MSITTSSNYYIYPTYEQMVEALERNGLKQVKGSYLKKDMDTGEILGACAIGQIAENLDYPPSTITERLNKHYVEKCPSKAKCEYSVPLPESHGYYTISAIIFHLNDYHGWKFSTIAKWMRNARIHQMPSLGTFQTVSSFLSVQDKGNL